jgi:hypothetical protein
VRSVACCLNARRFTSCASNCQSWMKAAASASSGDSPGRTERKPAAAVGQAGRPGARCHALGARPLHRFQCGQHARARDRGFSDPRSSDQDRATATLFGERAEHGRGLGIPAVEIVGVGLGHRFEAAIGIDQLPQRSRGCDGLTFERGEDAMQRLVLGDDRNIPQSLPTALSGPSQAQD